MKNRLILFLLLILLLAGCSGADAPEGNEQLRILTETYPPYNFVNKDGEITGQSTEMVRAIMNEVGVESEIEVLTLSEALDLAEKGPGVVLYSLNLTPEREDLFKWVGPIGIYEQVFYTLAESEVAVKDLEDAKKVKKIAVYEGDAGAQFLKSQGFKNLDERPTDVEALQKLADGEVDLWLGNREGLAVVATQAGVDPTELMEVPAIIIHANLFIAFSKDVEDEVIKAWQEAYDRLKEERDTDDKTFVEKVEAKYNDPSYVDSLIK
jgi:ABC-type amino acid transport substrate-binding protein